MWKKSTQHNFLHFAYFIIYFVCLQVFNLWPTLTFNQMDVADDDVENFEVSTLP